MRGSFKQQYKIVILGEGNPTPLSNWPFSQEELAKPH